MVSIGIERARYAQPFKREVARILRALGRIMLLKSKDDLGPQIAKLDELLELRISLKQRAAIVREKALIQAGARAERDAAFEIDFRLKDHKNWAVIHDLRLEHKGRTAQIDHLIVHPNWDFYVVETKGIHTKLKIEKGQWCFLHNSHWCGMANPVEQNDRHIQVLREVLRDFDWLPRTMGIRVVPRFINVVLVPPECLIRQEGEHTWVLHMDEFVTKARRDIGLGNLMCNLVHNHDGGDAMALGNKLVALHHPFQIDYAERFGIAPTPNSGADGKQNSSGKSCDCCKGSLSNAEAFFCRHNKARFAGQNLCRKCQAYVPVEGPKLQTTDASFITGTRTECCARCGEGVSTRVVSFCLGNHARFGGKVYCRACQANFKQAVRPTVTA